ncbi:MAG: amidohydrolase [Altibacter sp.]|uniref:amidohydrolase n=1 Tax=Altibacter sp. TaxID=2024823 RepID=UPI001D288153|nr:amidohydrolase [Altibacter sp.]MBZ0327640.1 amidohydrolase [Altibacter sp.]
MQKTLTVTIIQADLHWENPVANRTQFSEKIKNISGKTDLIVLPEMFTTGFTMNAEKLSEEDNGETLQWMISEAKKNNAAITGSIIISENNTFYNRLFFVFPNGTYKIYDKRHTFTLAGEDKTYTAGTQRLIVDYKGFKICPLICYDLRFPVWARNTENYDLLLYVANWPVKRIVAWDVLLKARAIENMSYCIGVNRVGLDGTGHEYTGHSAVYDVLGNCISTPNFEKELIETVVLEKEHIDTHRKHLQFLNDRDHFNLN